MSDLPKATDYLKAKGWRPIRPDAHPQDTGWIDPLGGKVYDHFIDAVTVQFERDKKDKADARPV
jgi:hypothetical protein